jgi:acetyl-CoA C-acetyltransferase
MHVVDEGLRWDASAEGMAKVKLLMDEGVITAATSSQVTDGASAVMLVSEQAVKDYGLTPLALLKPHRDAGDPVMMRSRNRFSVPTRRWPGRE